MERISDSHVLDWLDARARQDPPPYWAGYDADGWEMSVWILHAMYEAAHLPGGLTHDDVHRMELAAGTVEPLIVFGINLDERLAMTVPGAPLGRSESPGPDWSRLAWSELARRLDVDLFANGFPCHTSFPHKSWPANIRPPAEGSLDLEQFLRLVDHLAVVTSADAYCFAFYGEKAVGEIGTRVLYRGRLKDLVELYEHDDVPGSPSNIWPVDKSWLVYTDWDLWGTKVSGNAELIGSMTSDTELETVVLDV